MTGPRDTLLDPLDPDEIQPCVLSLFYLFCCLSSQTVLFSLLPSNDCRKGTPVGSWWHRPNRTVTMGVTPLALSYHFLPILCHSCANPFATPAPHFRHSRTLFLSLPKHFSTPLQYSCHTHTTTLPLLGHPFATTGPHLPSAQKQTQQTCMSFFFIESYIQQIFCI
jgi:hypothetical protein